ncbi:hypothetical protein ADMFC3_12160 [Geovibrio sp. ADMFC3]
MDKDMRTFIGATNQKSNFLGLFVSGILIFGSLWTITYYFILGIAPHLDQSFFIGYLFVIAMIGGVVFFPFIAAYSFAWASIFETFNDLDEDKLIGYLFLSQIIVFFISSFGAVALKFDWLITYLYSISILLILTVEFLYKKNKLTFLKNYKKIDLFLAFGSSIAAPLLLYTCAVLVFIKDVKLCIVALTSVALLSVIFELVAIIILLFFLKEKIASHVLIFVILFVVGTFFLAFNKENNQFNVILGLPFKILKLGSNDAALLFDNNSKPNAIDVADFRYSFSEIGLYKVHILSSIGSEYIVRKIDGDKNSPIIRIPKTKVKAVIYNYKEPEALRIAPIQPSLMP